MERVQEERSSQREMLELQVTFQVLMVAVRRHPAAHLSSNLTLDTFHPSSAYLAGITDDVVSTARLLLLGIPIDSRVTQIKPYTAIRPQ